MTSKTILFPDLFSDDDETVINFNHDPIALVVYRDMKQSRLPLHDLDEVNHIHEELEASGAFRHANRIREHFKKKIFFIKLNDHLNMTEFRKELDLLLNQQNKLEVPLNCMGMLQRLNTLYEEDMVRQQIKDQCNTKEMSDRELDNRSQEHVLVYVAKTQRRRTQTFWFKNETNRVVGLDVESNNPFINIWEKHLNQSPAVSMTGHLTARRQDDFFFYNLKNAQVC